MIININDERRMLPRNAHEIQKNYVSLGGKLSFDMCKK
jgi:hypothetical protein